ncbi:oleate hydratase [Streptomyces sp. NBC_01622]|uniref:oleate hydratase n=1 Tax=Streptomyces sp. NBC_01622 TaxID=2975903 RepID=UPI00386F7B1C|nr:oleate hydratase [Streptomyces sp. NBC_01622]
MTRRSPARLWETLAAEQPGRLGDPSVFKSLITDATWPSFTVTTKEPTFFEPGLPAR